MAPTITVMIKWVYEVPSAPLHNVVWHWQVVVSRPSIFTTVQPSSAFFTNAQLKKVVSSIKLFSVILSHAPDGHSTFSHFSHPFSHAESNVFPANRQISIRESPQHVSADDQEMTATRTPMNSRVFIFVADGINSVGDYNSPPGGCRLSVCLCVCPHFFSRFTIG